MNIKERLDIERKINNMPRKALGYKTSLEVFENQLKELQVDTSFLDKYKIFLPKCNVFFIYRGF